MSQPPNRALFLDRDGVINVDTGFLFQSADVRFVPGIFSLCRTAQRLGYKLFVVTNQSGIARGYYTESDFHILMDWMRNEFQREGIQLDAVYFSPYHPEHGIGDYRREHEDRKPDAGMLLQAAREFDLSLPHSLMVGDRCSDIAAANKAGLRQAFLLDGTESAGCKGNYVPAVVLAEIERWLVQNEPSLQEAGGSSASANDLP
jgi:D-glycero-D-manno-heptose 1,7-bisphosphate phosphatase